MSRYKLNHRLKRYNKIEQFVMFLLTWLVRFVFCIYSVLIQWIRANQTHKHSSILAPPPPPPPPSRVFLSLSSGNGNFCHNSSAPHDSYLTAVTRTYIQLATRGRDVARNGGDLRRYGRTLWGSWRSTSRVDTRNKMWGKKPNGLWETEETLKTEITTNGHATNGWTWARIAWMGGLWL